MAGNRSFNLAEVLAGVSDSGSAGREQIVYLNILQLDSDSKNFYALDGVDELAANIETIGLQQPLRVRKNPDAADRWIVVSGHRRLAALWVLVNAGGDRWREVPCIEDKGSASPALTELRLIYANSDTRRMSPADIAKQAERIEALLYELKEQGYDFPGRMRDHVAEACKVSKSKLARLKVIRDGLIPAMAERFESSQLTEQAAYAIARLPRNVQEDLQKLQPKKAILGNAAENILAHYEQYYSPKLTCPSGEACTHTSARMGRAAGAQYGWEYCDGGCCLKCHASCSRRCAKSKAQMEVDKAEKAKQREKDEKAAAREKEKLIQQSRANAARLLPLIDAAGLSDKTEVFGGSWSHFSVGYIRDLAAGKLDEKLRRDYLADARFDYAAKASWLAETADQLHCSVDWLLGRETPEPQTAAAPAEPTWQTGTPPRSGLYYCRFDCGGTVICEPAYYGIERWYFGRGFSNPVGADCLAWYPLPEEKEVK